MNFRKIIYFILTIAIILLSFFLYSSRFYPLLNSDDALNVLMAHYYKLPDDFYCWGQDRGGTLIPLVSQLFMKLFNCSALISVSLSNYFILILGYLGFSSLIKSDFYKIILAIVWFLPFQRFIDIVRFPIGVEYSLIGFTIYLIGKLENFTFKWYVRHLLLISIVLVFTVSVWVSDLAIVSIISLFLILLLFNFTKTKCIRIDITMLVYFFLGVLSCLFFISYARTFAITKTEIYLSINGIHEVTKALVLIKEAFLEVLTLKTNEIFVTIYTYLGFLFIIFLGIVILKKRLFVLLLFNKWIIFF